jgi:phosphopantetheine adenylyltransferase
LEQSNKLKEINCIVIPKTLNKNEISEYETKLQMAEDSKLEYDPINIYLKVNKLLKEKKEEILNQEARYKAVSQLMGSTKYNKNIIKTFGETFDVMEDYLISIGKEKKYKELEHKEDQFKNFSKF